MEKSRIVLGKLQDWKADEKGRAGVYMRGRDDDMASITLRPGLLLSDYLAARAVEDAEPVNGGK